MVDIYNPDCNDCGHTLQRHYVNEGPNGSSTGCVGVESEGDCQCAAFISKDTKDRLEGRTAEEMVGGKILRAEVTAQGLCISAVAPEDVKNIVDEIPPAEPMDLNLKARNMEEVIRKLGSGEWSMDRALAEMTDLEKAAAIFYDAADPATSMQTEEFTRLIEEQIDRSTSLLIDKAKEYASDTDRLHNFKIAAGLLGGTQEQALGGFLAKHIVSVFDMINSGKDYPIEVWNEKITDSINYLLILRAMQR